MKNANLKLFFNGKISFLCEIIKDGKINCEKKRCPRVMCQNQKNNTKKQQQQQSTDDECCQCHRARRHNQRKKQKQQDKHQNNLSKS